MEEKLAFDRDTQAGEMNSGVKLDGGKSMFKPRKPEDTSLKERFDEQIKNHQENEKNIMGQIRDLSIKFSNIIKDQTLSINKSPLDKQKENDVIKELIQLSLILNNDETESEGAGSTGINFLLMKALLIQRDQINNLNYEIFKLNKKIDG